MAWHFQPPWGLRTKVFSFSDNGNAIHITEHVQNEHDVDGEFDIVRDLSNETLLSCFFDSGVVTI